MTLSIAFAGSAWAYNESYEFDGDLSDFPEYPTVIEVPPEGLTITGSMINISNENGTSIDLDYFTLAIPAGVTVTALTIDSDFAGSDATFTVWESSTEATQGIDIDDATPAAFFPGDMPRTEGSYSIGFLTGNPLVAPYYAQYNYVITVVTDGAPAVPTQIEADTSDFTAGPFGTIDAALPALGVGDAGDPERIAFVKFDITDLLDADVTSATLRLSVLASEQSGDPDNEPPFGNPGLGDVIVEQIPDYETPDIGDLTLVAGPNSPGVIIPGTVNPDQDVSIDVLAALQDAIDAGDDWVAFRIKTAGGPDEDSYPDFFTIASANNATAALRPILDLTASGSGEPVVVIPPDELPPVGVPNSVLVDRTVDPNTPIELLATIKATGDESLRIWSCASRDPRYNEVTATWDVRDAAITEFLCPDVPGFADMDNIVPSYLQANVNDDGQAWVGFVFVDSAIEFTDVVAGQALWENVDSRIKVDDCDVPVADRDVDAWGSLTADPYNEERFLESAHIEVAGAQCNRSRLLSRRGSVFSGPWNDEISPQRLVWNQFVDSLRVNGSAESRACVPGSIRFRIFLNQFAAGVGLWRSQDYASFVSRMEAADKIAHDNAFAYAGCTENVLGALRSHLTRAAFIAHDRIINADVYVKYIPPNHVFPEDDVPEIIE